MKGIIMENNQKFVITYTKQNGESVTNGIYSYSIEFLDFKNKPFIYTGTVNLIR